MAQHFNPFEKTIARVLSNTPWIKKIAKFVYSFIFYFLKKKNYRHKAIKEVKVINDGIKETFFGYYDKCPDNGNGLVLVYSTEQSTKLLPSKVDSIELDVFCIKTQQFILPQKLHIFAFNWQQASRSHWLDEDLFVYNNYDGKSDSYFTSVYSISEGKVIRTYEYAVQDSFQNKFMLSICYKSLALLRPDYGYFKHHDTKLPEHDKVGVWKCDYTANNEQLLFTVSDVCEFEFDKSKNDYKHKLNHVMISPNGQFFIFMHRYYNKNGRRFDRLILANSNGDLLKVLADNEMVSHCFWYDELTVLGYLRAPDGQDSYWLIDINLGEYRPFHDNVFAGRGDGHPSANGNYIVTDTYPDKSRMQSLYLTSKDSTSDIKLGEFFHGFNFSGETRCDLHPRFSKNGDLIFFDSIFSGKRKLCYLDISSVKKKFIDNE